MKIPQHIIDFTLPDSDGLINFLHRTGKEEYAQNIMKEGFIFCESFDKTTDIVVNNNVHINYWLRLRVDYGNYLIVISFSQKLLNQYESRLAELKNYLLEVFQLLCEKDPIKDDDDNEIYTLSNHFIKGYVDLTSGLIKLNPEFNPHYDSSRFLENIDFLSK